MQMDTFTMIVDDQDYLNAGDCHKHNPVNTYKMILPAERVNPLSIYFLPQGRSFTAVKKSIACMKN